jgi:hypothetical protein
MGKLGFVQYDAKTEFYLIPSWLYPFLKNGVNYYDAGTGDVITNTNYMKARAIYGMLSYGVKPCDVIVSEEDVTTVGEELDEVSEKQ